MLSRLFLQQEKKASLPHAMLSLLFPDPLPFSVHPQEVSLCTRRCTVAQIAEAGASGMVTSPNTAVRLPSADPGVSRRQPSHASYKSQHGNFCKSIAEYTWMLSNPIQAKGQLCKSCCTLGISSTKLCHVKPICYCQQGSYNLQGMIYAVFAYLYKAPKQDLINYNPKLNDLHSYGHFHMCYPEILSNSG